MTESIFLKDKILVTKEFFTKDESQDILEDNSKVGKVEATTAIHNKVIGLFFSAGWCPPCQEFVPLLKDLYEELHRRDSPIEIIFISFDKTSDDMKKYFLDSQGDWLAVPFGDPLVDELKSQYGVTAIPRLIVVREDGEIITSKARKEVQDKGIVCFKHWLHLAHINTTRDEQPETTDDNNEKENKDKTTSD